MPLDRSELLAFLGEVDKELDRDITLVAVGGTALTILGVKPSTVDIDFTLPSEDYDEFKRALKNTPHGYRVDYWKDGFVFSQVLPEDYLKKSRAIRKMKHIQLKALHPVDIVITKIGRLDQRDKVDIQSCIKKFGLTKAQIARRAEKVEYVGRHENYSINLKYVLKNFFKK